jgi:adenylylsulfate kinase
MIVWLTGNSGAGKTTLARWLSNIRKAVILDGDEMRESISSDLGLSAEDRRTHNIRVAKLAKILSDQGHYVIVSLICPYENLREEVRKITNCIFVYIKGGKVHKDYPYEVPINTADIIV